MGLWATTVETARAGLAGVRIKQGAEGAASAVRRVSVLRGMFLYAFLLRPMGFISKANTTRFQKKVLFFFPSFVRKFKQNKFTSSQKEGVEQVKRGR